MAQMRIEASLRASEGEVPLALRVGWLAVVVGATLLGLFSLPAYYHSLLTACSGAVCNLDGSVTAADVQALGAAGVTPQAYATYTVALYCLILPVWLLVALLIFLQRPNDPGALLIALILATANVFAVNGPVTALVF
ncbi:MAG TPA: hypothetical protein VFN78_10595, partial [Ktedonobacterales bacterium]|nr:hypothetical protein [Ktedonobacterales bacterium]